MKNMSTFNSADIAAFTGGVWVFCEQRQGKMMSTSYEPRSSASLRPSEISS